MLKNYLKIAFRNFKKQKAFSLINIFGLTIGITAVILIALNIKNEYSFNSFHKNIDRIYRVNVLMERDGKIAGNSYLFVPPIGPAMLKDFPEVKNFVRFSTNRTMYINYENNSFKIENVTYADSSLFKVFTFNMLEGSPDKALASPYSIILTKNTASKIFGREDPSGKIISINNNNYKISGIIQNSPGNSDIQFNAIISFSTLYRDPANWMGWNGGNQYITYVQLNKNASSEEIDKKFPDFLWLYLNKDLTKIGIKYKASLQPLKDIHLRYNEDSASLRNNTYLFSIIALFILFIACINFINLSTAKSSNRAKEVGMRKVLGALHKSLIVQFLSESIIICTVSILIALMLAELLLPWYNALISKHLSLSGLLNSNFILFLPGILIITGLAAGLYPAFLLASYKPVIALKGDKFSKKQRFLLKKLLVILQFVISIVLIISTFTIQSQLDFMRNKKLGFNKDNIVVIPLVDERLKTRYEIFKNEMSKIPGVVSTSASSDIPLNGFTSNGYFPEGYDSPLVINVVDADEDFLNTFNIKLIKGRNFKSKIQSDKDAYIINQSLARYLNWKEPINKTIKRNGIHPVIGEVKDFNYASLYYKIQPLIITHKPWHNQYDYISVKIKGGNIPGTMNSISEAWENFAPGFPFEYNFLDQTFDKIYKSDIKFRQAFSIFSIFAIFIALLGLLGLASYSIELRRKEIGVRKVLGSSVPGIFILLIKEYSMLIIIAAITAFPIAFYVTTKWLQEFAYKVNINFWIFFEVGIFVLCVAILVIGIQAVKYAMLNPAESLRHE